MSEARRVVLETGAATVVECWGEAGPAIVCVHGAASSRRAFARLGEALATTHRVFAYDQRGHGDAESASPDALDVLAADLRAVADSIGTVAAVVGYGSGGAVALAGGPKVARALVLVDPAIRADAWDLRERLRAPKVPVTVVLAGGGSAAPDDIPAASDAVRVHTFERDDDAGVERFAELVREAVPG